MYSKIIHSIINFWIQQRVNIVNNLKVFLYFSPQHIDILNILLDKSFSNIVSFLICQIWATENSIIIFQINKTSETCGRQISHIIFIYCLSISISSFLSNPIGLKFCTIKDSMSIIRDAVAKSFCLYLLNKTLVSKFLVSTLVLL